MSSCCTSILNKQEFTPLIMPGRWIRVEPVEIWGWFVMPRTAIPEMLPPKTVNIATKFTTQLSAMLDTGQQTELPSKVTAWDVQGSSLAHYRLYCNDAAVSFKVFQPGARARFDNKAGALTIDKRLTDYALRTGQLNLLPEIFLLEDATPVTIKATSMDMDSATYDARITAIGWRYPLIKVDINATGADGKRLYPEPNKIPAVTIYVGNKQ